jgi:hypothetical protein
MRIRTLRIVLMLLTLAVIMSVLGVWATRQSAQDAQSRQVLIEKDKAVSASSVTEPAVTITNSALVDDSLPNAFVSATQRFERDVIKGVPFQAEVRVNALLPQRDRTIMTRTSTYVIYRDSEGRTRRDTESRSQSWVNDPVDGGYVLNHRAKTVRKVIEDPATTTNLAEPGSRGTAPGFKTFDRQQAAAGQNHVRDKSVQLTQESLGKREIDGMLSEGTRYVRTIFVGTFGNEQPVKITTEEWYSTELQTLVLVTVSDPRFGQSEYRLVNIVRGEPSPALFVIPPAYKVKVE